MSFRLKLISPLAATPDDLARRQRRYQEHARPGTVVTVDNLTGRPPALDTAGDVLASAAAMLAQGRRATPAEWDAILVDCVFDPAVEELAEATSIPTFGPTRLTLPLVRAVARRFAIVARTRRQCELLGAQVARYGHRRALVSLRALDLSYEEAKRPEAFEAAMAARLQEAVRDDGAEAIVLGSTTMALTPALRAAAGGVPLFMPGLVALRVLEQLWHDGLWPAAGPGRTTLASDRPVGRRPAAGAAARVEGPRS